MSSSEIKPKHITKPIQLLGAWLAGLAIIDASFLTAASTINTPSWIPGLLSIAAVINVPIFLFSLFLLQTKFRPEMQEDTYYSQYLDKKYSGEKAPTKPIDLDQHFEKLTNEILTKVEGVSELQANKVSSLLKESEKEILLEQFENNRSLSELYMHADKWCETVDIWEGVESFEMDTMSLAYSGLAIIDAGNYKNAKLTAVGKEVANRLKEKNLLWNQHHERW